MRRVECLFRLDEKTVWAAAQKAGQHLDDLGLADTPLNKMTVEQYADFSWVLVSAALHEAMVLVSKNEIENPPF